MNSKYLAKQRLPDKSGVYIFKDYRNRPIYIGRATSLRDRTKSYFANDLISTRGPRIVDMVTKSKSISWYETGSVLEAIILESALIKKYQPAYNVDERDDKSGQYVIITDEDWPRVFLARARDLEKMQTEGNISYKIKKKYGPFTESSLIKESMKILRKMFPFKDFKSNDVRHDTFYKAIGRSPEVNGENNRINYLRTIKYLILFFEGKGEKLRMDIEKDMHHFAKKKEFEQANQAKKLIYALDHINDVALIKNKKENLSNGLNFRIEAFDIAHTSGTNVVGAMAVSIDSAIAKGQYRKFKVSVDKNNDLAGLAEILDRRLNHPEWPYPDLIIVDGNERQYEIACNILKIRRVNIPVVAVKKDEKHRASEFIGNPEIINKYKKDIVKLNAEVHRFVLRYHQKKRNDSFGLTDKRI